MSCSGQCGLSRLFSASEVVCAGNMFVKIVCILCMLLCAVKCERKLKQGTLSQVTNSAKFNVMNSITLMPEFIAVTRMSVKQVCALAGFFSCRGSRQE